MRTVLVRCLNDGTRFELGCDVEVICAVIEQGRAIDQITYETQMTGDELSAFVEKFRLQQRVTQPIIKNNVYVVTAYDW